MITVHGSGPSFGLPETSPFVMKTVVQLKMAGIPFNAVPAQPTDSPKGQIPFIEDEGAVVADSTFIRAYLEDRFGFDLDEGLTLVERAHAWAIERMVEDHLRGLSGCARFLIPENFEKGPARWFDGAPEHMRAEMKPSPPISARKARRGTRSRSRSASACGPSRPSTPSSATSPISSATSPPALTP